MHGENLWDELFYLALLKGGKCMYLFYISKECCLTLYLICTEPQRERTWAENIYDLLPLATTVTFIQSLFKVIITFMFADGLKKVWCMN